MKRRAAVLVTLQFVLLAFLVLAPRGGLWPLGPLLVAVAVALIASGLVLVGLGLRGLGPALTVSPIPRQQAPLVTGGVYGFARHPIYTGLMLAGFGLALLGASPWHLIAWLGLVVLLGAKARWEERMLLAEHPDYAAYAARVGRFLPGIGRR